ncbi:2-C-methyl-D-erythritol 4-phosphate cytidylyltransferase-domain-containing protein [Ochromonadaceae sp. CCMP2298]|nr:2-C-methyl-D-erythritol 4-phosphate cytidylyltransferase-domain-containing protein [Ochromonadaceae sp. CCMP2298]
MLLSLLVALLLAAQCSAFVAPLTARKSLRITPTLNAGNNVEVSDVGVVLLAGGKGSRMKSAIPKQFLKILGKPVFLRSLDVFTTMGSVVTSIVIVMDKSFRDEYAYLLEDARISWADPGKERQGSVYNGISGIPDSCRIVAVHDSARPLVTQEEVLACLSDGLQHGAAVLGVPMKATVKESEDGQFVLRTVPRSTLWEIHTPQVATKQLFLRGFEKVQAENLEVTDDVSVVEALGEPVKLTLGQYTNIKITTPDDLPVAEQILRERGVKEYSEADEKSFACSSERYRGSLSRK